MTADKPSSRLPWEGVPDSLQQGALYVVSTPIGNMADFTPRGAWALAHVDRIAAEDTRHTALLLARHGIQTSMVPYHEHNAQRMLPRLIADLESGKTIALVSDAGTPGVSDPGYRLITEAAERGLTIVPIPGASALLAALVAAGLPMDRFAFEGFLPRKKGRQTRLGELAQESRTVVIYESPLRTGKTLADLAGALGGARRAAVCRELTKTFEEILRGTLSGLAEKYSTTPPKGEIVIVVEGLTRRKRQGEEISPGGEPPDGSHHATGGGGLAFPAITTRGKQGRRK
ncbi:MAG: 16S rRNA (cytidine(1402)-2'-O)-methyltransferase [bacterium]